MSTSLRILGLAAALGGLFVAAVVPACGGNPEIASTGGASSSSGTGKSSSSTSSSGVSTSSSGSGGASSSSSSGAGGTPPCTGDGDCAGKPGGAFCDTKTGQCVECLPTNDKCGMGQYCNASNTCVVGCGDDTDCNKPTVCDKGTHQCVGCQGDPDCMPGTICVMQACQPGCNPMHDCQMGSTCCSGQCADTTKDTKNCGGCNMPCPTPDNTVQACVASMCKIACEPAFADCDGTLMNGCEHNKLVDGPCLCAPGSMQACYQGAPGTQNVGPCKAGKQVCDPSGTSWGPCVGQVLPIPEICANNVDDDCNGAVDDVQDIDGDGWTRCNGDCCETLAQCSNPAQVNPGAFEIVGDGVDNDCDPNTSDVNPAAACSTMQKTASVTAQDLANAMDICQTTTANPPLPQKKWGLITSKLLLADGSNPNATALSDIQNKQIAALVDFGTVITPKKAKTFAGMSTGYMRDEDDLPPNPFIDPDPGTSLTTSLTISGAGGPLGFFSGKHGGALPSGNCNGMTCPTGTSANDSVNLELQIRVPTNAQSFSYDFRFFTAEYQAWQCTVYNDFFLALLTSGAAGIPADHQISFDANKNPISVNNAFFQVCPGNALNCGACPNGTGDLAGTGMELFSSGGGTTWLTTDAPVVPGETITLDFQIFDTEDHILDSLVILDNFRWNTQALPVGTHQ